MSGGTGTSEGKRSYTKCLRISGAIEPADLKLNIHGKTLDFIIDFFDLKSSLSDLMTYSDKNTNSLESLKALRKQKKREAKKGKKANYIDYEGADGDRDDSDDNDDGEDDEWEVLEESSPLKKRKASQAAAIGFEKYSDFESSTDSEQDEE